MIELMVFAVLVTFGVLAFMASRQADAKARKVRCERIQNEIDMEAKKKLIFHPLDRSIRVQDNRLAYERRLKAFVDNNVEIIVK